MRKLPVHLILSLSFILSSCSVPKRFQRRVETVERGMNDMRVVQAELIARVDSLENRSRKVNGRIEELQYSQSYRLGGDVNTLKKDLSRLQRRLPPPALVPQLALEEDEALLGRLEPEAGRRFRNELNRMRTGSYRSAIPGLEELSASGDVRVPEDLRARALFWLGVAREGTGDNPDALRAYHAMTANFPTHGRVPLALLRQASVFVRLKDVKTARLTLQKLIAQYSKTPEAADAREKLKKLR